MSDYENDIIQKIVSFGENNDQIRAILLTSSQCNPTAPIDILSDFDVELFFEEPMAFVENDEWIKELGFGPIMAIWHWPNEWDEEKNDGRRWTRMVYFQDGTKMDISLCYLEDLLMLNDADKLPDCYDIGYQVLLDKDGVTSTLKPPTYKAYILSPPSEAQYLSRIESFWMDSTYVAKYLWRDDIVPAKWRLHDLSERYVREMLEWSTAMDHGWNWKSGCQGRGLVKALSHEIAGELIESYAAGDTSDLWDSLFKTTALFRKTAIKVGENLGYSYPLDLDRRVSAFHEVMRNLDRNTTAREALAEALRKAFE